MEDDHNDHPEVEIQEDDQEGSTENNDIINDDQQHRYNLRYRKVNLTTINNGQLKTFTNNLKDEKSFTPILKFKNYITADNFKLDYFKLSDRAHFRANKRGWLLHNLNCKKEFCIECDFHKMTKNFFCIENNMTKAIKI